VAELVMMQYGPSGVIINQDADIVYVARGAGRFLQVADGPPSSNLLKGLQPELQFDVQRALYQARQDGQRVQAPLIHLRLGQVARQVSVMVQPLAEPAWMRGYALILFHDMPEGGENDSGVPGDGELLTRQLEEEIQRTRDRLRIATEQHDVAIEEHHASTEELQAINEELRATTEELETSKEELQAINEELLTVNHELNHKVDELSRANSDLQNLMASTAIGTIFVDRELRIKRYTPSAQALVNLMPVDVNRPLAHLTHRLADDQLIADATRVLQTLAPIEREVAAEDGRWYMLRIQSHRSETDQIDGVVLTFVDITRRRLAEEALRRAHAELEQRVEERTEALVRANQALEAEAEQRREAEQARQEVLRQLVTAQEEIQGRIALELHDQFGQSTAALRLWAAQLSAHLKDPERQAEHIDRLKAIVLELDSDIQRLARDLRPRVLDMMGLAPALQEHLETWAQQTGIVAQLEVLGDDPCLLPSVLATVLYRVVQEALTNVLKHADATKVSVVLQQQPDQVQVTVEDNGQGIPSEAAQSPGRLGLQGGRERVTLVGGRLDIESSPGKGTTIFVRIPLPSS
jgi:two-component system CheB/CheR fusion protein